ncbi:alkaline phosphatase family protein [Amycolatopsis nigrescens]|uniref:alkaline phosphatase family protein n=1 Tax=Amycolatopsis nigrescens TaxID=381445 RepID=UPI000361B151|nr:alkaline phosphatase family protein [Amycolatopsis nigrescens]
MRRGIVLLTVLTTVLGLSTGVPATAAPAKTPKALVIGLDGARFDKLLAADTPNVHKLVERGYAARSALYGSGMAPTVSGPGWSTILTGVWPDKHKVKDNSFAGNALADHPSWLARAEQAAPALDTYAAVDWQPIGDRILRTGQDRKFVLDGDSAGYQKTDEQVAVDAEKHLAADKADASFVYFGQTDEAGHEHGADSPEYDASLRTDDALIGRLLAAVEKRPSYQDEDWLVLLSTDHGHTPAGGHGGDSPEERMTFVIAAGGAVPPGKPSVAPKIVDIAPTVLRHLGIGVAESWGYDGYPLGAAPADVFDGAALKPRQDETGVPADLPGWTHDGPGGWSVHNAAAMPAGTAEWQGWAFTTDEFWTRTAPGQQREANVRARGVFAVADPDEWDDKGSPSARGEFDSTLRSPAIGVDGKSEAEIGFVSHYRQDGTQRGSLTVSFDGGPEQPVLAYGPDAGDANRGGDILATPVSAKVRIPAGAREMRVSWRLYAAGNNWYWAVDAPRVSTR